jgi:hypothetical protein
MMLKNTLPQLVFLFVANVVELAISNANVSSQMKHAEPVDNHFLI